MYYGVVHAPRYVGCPLRLTLPVFMAGAGQPSRATWPSVALVVASCRAPVACVTCGKAE